MPSTRRQVKDADFDAAIAASIGKVFA